jgi:murein DD-endopeptidase MepM/ murein hydrolase activator NlpD
MKIIGTILLFAIFISSSYSQTLVYGNLTSKVDSIIATIPSGNGTDQYQAPSSGQLTQWSGVITKILQKDYSGANSDASAFGYFLMQFIDTTTNPRVTYYILLKTISSSNYWGTYFLNSSPARPKIVVYAPHPLNDLYTGKQARQIFVRNGLRSFFLSGTHRCNSSIFTTCSGTTTSCSDTSAKYRASDQAHIVNGMFQKTTEIMKSLIPGLIGVQAHGFGQDTGDPDVIMSNGTRYTPTTDYLVTLRNNLLVVDPTLTFKIAHIDLTWTKLLATENTQGRLINNSSNPCSNGATTATGRFLHLEQALSGLRDSEANRKKLSDAIGMTFSADTLTILSPNGGETWLGGSANAITWSKKGFVDSVKLEYTLDNGNQWKTIISSTPNTGSYSWSVVSAGTWRARIRVSDVANSATVDVSDGKFKIDYSVWPISGTTTPDGVASAFGPRILSGVYDFHKGIDLPNSLDTPVHPVKRGVIVRLEDTTQTIGTGLERYGNWILVRHDSSGGQARHTAYLHLNGFSQFNVGDTVATTDTIGFVGKSGVGINTIHTHLEYYENLSGTSIDKDKAMNPFKILSYPDLNSYVVNTTRHTDSTIISIQMPDNELDFDEITFYGELATKVIGYNSRIGIDPSNNDNPRHNNVFIDPALFTIDSSYKTIQFWTRNSEIGNIDSFKIKDINGYSFIVVDYSGMRYAVASGNWNSSIWASTPGGAPGSVSPPTQYDDVVINPAVTVTVPDIYPACRSVSFSDATSKIAMNSAGRLNVYGDFTIYSTTHDAFSYWESGGKLRFTGSAKQMLTGWSNTSSTDISTTLMEMQVDKSGDTLKTPRTDMKLAIGNSIEILNGVFLLDSLDDINGKSFDGSTGTTPIITISAGGSFNIKGGASHIRSGTTGSNQIGKMTINGKAVFTTTSSLGINFGGIDINNGGTLYLTTGWSANRLNPGTITIKTGGLLSNSTTSNVWNAASTVLLQNGGEYKTSSSITVFPPAFTNLGTVHYARTASGDQTIVDTSYYRLEISYSGNNKIWDLKGNRSIADTLEINNNATLALTASTAHSLGIASTLRLSSGTLNNSDADASLSLSDGALISRATGTLTSAPSFGSTVNVRYTSTTASVSTGPELPVPSSVLNNLTILCDTTTVLLSSPVTLNGTLTLSNGYLNNLTNNITFADGATIKRATGVLMGQPVFANKMNLAYISTVKGINSGYEIPSARGVLSSLSMESPMNVTLASNVSVKDRLSMVTGLIYLSDYDMLLDSSATVDGNPADTAMVVTNGVGIFTKYFTHPGSFTYPVGDTVGIDDYTPATVELTTGNFASDAHVGVRVLNTKHPSNNSFTDYINRYWIISNDGLSGYMASLMFNYRDDDIVGDENNIVLGQWTGSDWNIYNPADAAQNQLTGTVMSFSDFTGVTASLRLDLADGWNLISMPVTASDMRKTVLFPTSTSGAFDYTNGYNQRDTLKPGVGYWLKFEGNQQTSIFGSPVVSETVYVSNGWNIIGSVSSGYPVDQIVPLGTFVQSNYFGYDGMYRAVDSLMPGKGYWVKVSNAGQLIISPSAEIPTSKNLSKKNLSSLASDNRINSLSFQDRMGRKVTLYFTLDSENNLDYFESPPQLPGDAGCRGFDVRYSTNRYFENLNVVGKDRILPIITSVCTDDLPLKVSWEVKASENMAELVMGDRRIVLSGIGQTIITDLSIPIGLRTTQSKNIPNEFVLEQNYPNPFNPVTNIRYQLPTATHLKLSIFNIFGQEVATLVNEHQEAGFKSAEWDATGFPSGIYYYRLQSGVGVKISKMVLLK